MKVTKKMFCAMAIFAFATVAFTQVKITDITDKGKLVIIKVGAIRSTPYTIKEFPAEFKDLQAIFVPRGSSQKNGTGFSFKTDVPVSVYLLVDARFSKIKLDGWKKTALKSTWIASKNTYKDIIYVKDFPAGIIKIAVAPKGSIPHLAVIKKK